MRRSFLFTVALLCAVASYAEPVTKDQAAEKASAFLQARGKGDINTLSLAYQCRPQSTGTAVSAKDAYYYVFNNDKDGFVIVGGDDCADDVLGYSDTGSFDASNIPANLQGLLDSYAAEMEWARANNLTLPAQAKAKAAAKSNTRHAVAPLIKSQWTQHEPYNLMCATESGLLASAGCTAIAMAQVVNYHKWPRSSTSTIPAYSISGWGSRAALPATTFSWDLIKDNYSQTDKSDVSARNAVAKLVAYCGRSIRTKYSSSSSSAQTVLVGSALYNYFGYKNMPRNEVRSYYTTEEWNDLLVSELENGRPVIYAASKNPSYGHAFVIDGFDGNDMYHINWGWGYDGDGYFKLSALNLYLAISSYTSYPGSYSINQFAVVGISPTKIDDWMYGMTVMDFYASDSDAARTDVFTTTHTQKSGLRSCSIKFQYRKCGPENSYMIGMGIFKGDQLVDAKTINSAWTYSADTWGINNISLYGMGKNLADGEYTIRAIDRPNSNEEWKPSYKSDQMYVGLTLSNGTATLRTYPVPGTSVIKVSGVKQVHDVDDISHVVATFTNSGKEQYNGTVALYIDGYKKTLEGLYVSPGESVDVDFYFSATAAKHKLTLTLASGTTVYTNTVFVISETASLPALTLVSAKFNNLSNGILYGGLLDGEIVLKNNTKTAYDYEMEAALRVAQMAGGNLVYHFRIPVTIAAGETATVPIRRDLALGDKFTFIISDLNTTFVSLGATTVQPAVVMWDGSGHRTAVAPTATVTVPATATAVSFEEIDNIKSVTIKPNNNPNTLYYLPHGATVPTTLSKKNVVMGFESGAITLVGGYDFYVPKAFTASSISYSFTPTATYNGNGGWQTIMLPYEVTSVTSNGKAVDWCRKSDNDKQFLLKQFFSDKAAEVTFTNVDQWIPSTPYLLGTPGTFANKKMVFSASNAYVATTETPFMEGAYYRFVASTEDKTVSNALVLNESGTGFVKSTSGNVKAGGAYFLPLTKEASAVKALTIGGSTIITTGDANGDNEVTISDALSVVQFIQRGANLDECPECDVNGDGRFTVSDVMCIVRMVISKQ